MKLVNLIDKHINDKAYEIIRENYKHNAASRLDPERHYQTDKKRKTVYICESNLSNCDELFVDDINDDNI